jgi:hypothetical protein
MLIETITQKEISSLSFPTFPSITSTNTESQSNFQDPSKKYSYSTLIGVKNILQVHSTLL